MKWQKIYNNDTGPMNESFREWWTITNGSEAFDCTSEREADYLMNILTPVEAPSTVSAEEGKSAEAVLEPYIMIGLIGEAMLIDYYDAIDAMHQYASSLEAENQRLREGLQAIADSEGSCCMRCEGNGKLWADGKAHYPSYEGPTVNCGNCGGSGRIHEDIQEMASILLNNL